MSSEETFSISETSRLTGYTIPTIRKRLDVLKKNGAIQIGRNWSIPKSALFKAGLMKNPEVKLDVKPLSSMTNARISELEGALAVALSRAALAEAIADERQKSLDLAGKALLMLEAGKSQRRGFFGRKN